MRPTMTFRLRAALLSALVSLAGCELCDKLPPESQATCEANLMLNCDMNGDGAGDAHGTCDANQLCWVAGQAPGECV